jgi:hypothetical protein
MRALKVDANEVIGQLAGFIKYLNNSDMKGPKFLREPEEPYGNTEKLPHIDKSQSKSKSEP